MDSPARPHGAAAAIDALRESDAHRLDPVRFRFLEVLARRAESQQGDVRRVLDARLATLIAAYGGDLERRRSADGNARDRTPETASQRGAVGQLVDHLARHATTPGDACQELKALGDFRRTWSKLNAQQRLKQSLAQRPRNAGPLNSHHLVHRSLTLMRDLSPEYLHRFMVHADALLWLAALANPSRPDSDRKGTRAKAK